VIFLSVDSVAHTDDENETADNKSDPEVKLVEKGCTVEAVHVDRENRAVDQETDSCIIKSSQVFFTLCRMA